jgi:thermitase
MRCAKFFLFLAFMVCAVICSRAATSNVLIWQTASDRVTADVRGESLFPLLQDIAHQTGWHIFVEPEAARTVDVKFSDLTVGDALRKLLGNLNFALVPQTNGPDFLYVFTTAMQNATKPVTVAKAKPKHTSNELAVIVKPGTDIEALAKKFGAKIVGRNDKLHMYLLDFSDQAATDSALTQLQNDSDVEAVDYNYVMDPPQTPQAIANAPAGPKPLTLDPPTQGDPCSPVIGLVDTAYQSAGSLPDQFVMNPVSVVGNVTPTSTTITHATAMAETIYNAIAQSSGGHSSARLLPVDVYGNSETTTSWNVALGVQAAIDGGATVINMSLGGTTDSPILDSVIQQGISQGIVFFASAGNTPVNTPTYPAATSGVNAVTALGAPGQLASYANYGSFVEMALPGASYVYLGNQAYIVQGTSPASAYASGIAAGTKTVNCAGWPQIIAAMAQKFPVPAQ